jgi:predicted metal-dependent peptidase
MALFVPKEYTGKLIFEELYMWMKDEKEKWQKEKGKDKKDQSQKGKGEKGKGKGQQEPSDEKGEGDQSDGEGEGENDSTGKPSYGPYGKNPKNGSTDGLDTWSKEKIFEDLENGEGEYLDKHISDEVPEEIREAMVKDVMERLQARGFESGNVEQTLNKLQKKRKDYLKEIKRAVSNMIFGTVKQKTIVKPNRRQISGLKGNRKVKTKVNIILDVSGSMSGLVEKVLNYVYRQDIEINLIQADTKVNTVENLKSGKKLDSVKLVGFGGTVLQPAVDYVVENFNEFNCCVLTDGYCDSLDLSKLKGKVLIISAGVKVPVSKTNGKVKQILVEEK